MKEYTKNYCHVLLKKNCYWQKTWKRENNGISFLYSRYKFVQKNIESIFKYINKTNYQLINQIQSKILSNFSKQILHWKLKNLNYLMNLINLKMNDCLNKKALKKNLTIRS